jgi:Zn-dependent peptidase ImmA (M78 family)
MSSEAWTPTRAAIRITKQLNIFAEHHGAPRFPVNVTELALEAANLFCWTDPITDVQAASIPGFEGALFADHNRSRWMLLYNKDLLSSGRIRFTQAHELGHYILHRVECERFECTDKDMLNWSSEGRDVEAEADMFASYLLMPLDDYRAQIGTSPISLDLLGHCADRYGVSLTAATLKWLECTEESAVFMMSRDGFIDWACSSRRARAAGAFFRTRKGSPIPVPDGSLAANDSISHDRLGTEISGSVWFPRAEEQFSLRELKLRADQYDATFTLLLLPRSANAWPAWNGT